MGYSDDGVTQAALDAYYAALGKYGDLGVYSGGDAGALDAEAPWELARARALAEFIAATTPAGARLLDLGCSTGTLLVLLAERGFTRVSGIEPLPGAVSIAREARGLDVTQGWITTVEDPGAYDVVVLSHVLEHVLDIHEALGLIREALAADGLLVIEVPDAHRFHEYLHIPYQDFNTEHINHFSPAILSALIEAAGFEQVALHADVAGAGPEHPYPVIRGAWRRRDTTHAMAVDEGERTRHQRALAMYASVSEEMFQRIDARTVALVGTEEFAVWGAGQFTMKWLRREAFPREQLRFIVDSASSRGDLRLLDHQVVLPAAIDTDAWPPVVLTGSAYAEAAIADAAARMGIGSVVASPF